MPWKHILGVALAIQRIHVKNIAASSDHAHNVVLPLWLGTQSAVGMGLVPANGDAALDG